MQAAKQEDRFVQLDVGRFHRTADHKMARQFIEIPRDHKLDDLLQPHYFAHHARQIQAGRTIITALWDDMSQYAELLIVQAGSNYALAKVINYVNFEDAELIPAETKYEIEWMNPQQKHGVIRSGDRELMKSGFHSKADAQKYIDELSKQ